jgi:O-antigen/teichoic acid export membrane protein
VLAAMMLLAKESFAWLIYGSHATIEIIAWTDIALLAQVSYNFVYDVTLSLRQVRVLSTMQFFHGVFFAIFGIVGLSLTDQWMVLLPSYAGSCLMGAMVGGWCVWQKCGQEFRDDCRLDHREMWPRILPFAVSLWLSNLLAGSFELSDRYMLLHLSPGGESIGQAMVGQYYCGRIIPNLLTSVALTLSGILLPYLSADWEAGRQHDIQRRLGYVLSLVSLAFTAISVVALLGSPILFNVVFSGRYEAAHSVLHLSLLQCTWASLSMIAGAYLLCAERAKAASVNLLLGLVVNIGLNIPLIRHFGLTGSVVATLIANLVVLSLTIWTMRRAGCHTDTRTLLMLVVPVSLLFGTEFAAICLTILVVIAGRTDWILSHQDRTDIDAMLIPAFKKAHISMASLWPAARE